MVDEEELRKKHSGFEIGQELADLSVEELDELVELLAEEISRLKKTREEKSSHMSAAEALFKTSS